VRQIIDLWDGTHGRKPTVELGPSMFIVLSIGTAMKAILWLLCRSASRLAATSDMLMALAEDHLNDVWSNAGAIIAGAIATAVHSAWWLDATAALVISVLIIMRWVSVIGDQVKKVAGHTAPDDFVAAVNAIAVQHSPQLSVDVTRAYHFGSRFNVEMEIVLPGDMTVVESHDIALALQHKIEELEEVERAFVHVDYLPRDAPEHKVERQLLLASDAVSSTSHVTTTTAQNLQQRGRSNPVSSNPIP
jgi:divalent metal cation (Fe/Co/Zn/Cd) transporter